MAGAAAAPPNCARAVIDDWYGNSRVDRRYAPHCYREAIASLTPDQKDYLHAEEDILRALAYAKAGKNDPGAAGAGVARKASAKTSPSPKPSNPKPPSDTQNAIDDVPAADATSVPLPLVLLGGLAVTLLAAGGFGMASRRLRASRGNKAD